jgi:hypothetical protein
VAERADALSTASTNTPSRPRETEPASASRALRVERRNWMGAGLLALGVALLAGVLLFAVAMRRGINHDEHQFVAGAALLAREGLQPYRDFAWFHVPTLLYLYAGLFALSDQLLLAARTLSVVAAGGLVALLAATALGRPATAETAARWRALVLLVLLLLVTSAAYLHAAGRAWNHDVPILLTVAAFLAHLRGFRSERRAWAWHLGAGILLGLAAGTRLTFAPAAAAFLLAPWLFPGSPGGRWRAAAFCAGGLALGVAPTLYAAALDPQAFLFGNFRYAQLNTQYYQAQQPPDPGITLTGKALDALRFLLQPANVPLILFAALIIWRTRGAVRSGAAVELRFWLLLLPFLLLGALAPTPLQLQYLYVLFPFLALAILLAARHDERPQRWLPWLGAAALLTTALALPRYVEGAAILLAPGEWTPIKVHERGVVVASLASSSLESGSAQAAPQPGVAQPTVITLSPIDPLEGGARIDPRLATGPFAWRVAPFATPGERERYGLVGPEELAAGLAAEAPRALFGGLHDEDADGEALMVAWASARGYTPVPMADEGLLLLSPLAAWAEEGGATIGLGAHSLPLEPVEPGEQVGFTLYLTSDGPTRQNLNLLARGVLADGSELFRDDGWPYGAATSAWEPGALWPDGHTFTVAGDAKPGLARVEVSLYDPASLEAVGEVQRIGWLQVAPGEPLSAPIARFGQALALLSASLPSSARAGESLHVPLRWHAEATPAVDLTLFAHLTPADQVDAGAPPAAQADAPPLNGFAPTTLWPAGLVQADALTLPLPADLPPGEYTLLIGLYDPATYARLPVEPAAANDALRLGTLTVQP